VAPFLPGFSSGVPAWAATAQGFFSDTALYEVEVPLRAKGYIKIEDLRRQAIVETSNNAVPFQPRLLSWRGDMFFRVQGSGGRCRQVGGCASIHGFSSSTPASEQANKPESATRHTLGVL
jgi:hypothetical protein